MTLLADDPDAATLRRSREAAVIWTLWLTYGAFYFCRQNTSAWVPGLGEELGYTKEQIGTILAAGKLCYGAGQLVNGQLAERVSPRVALATGMLVSAALNVLFGFATGFYFLLFVWATNGYFQALGWTPTVRVMANWVPVERRGRAVGILGTGYQLGAVATILVAGWAAEQFGWRGALYLPAALLAAAAVFMLVCLREAPEERGDPALDGRGRTEEPPRGTLRANVRATVSNPALWVLAHSLALVDAVRYGYLDWGLAHLKEVQGGRIDTNAIKLAVLPVGGIAGALLAGWVSDCFFHSRRAPVICGLLVLLAILTLSYDSVARTSLPGTLALLGVIGFCIFGPQLLLVGSAPADLARGGTAAAAAGFVNFFGYMGAAGGDWVTGHVAGRYGWGWVVIVWSAWAAGASLVAALLWNARGAANNAAQSA